MKNTETITIPEKIIPQKTEEIVVYTCDICQKKFYEPYCAIFKCFHCGRDVCKKHLIEEYGCGDHPDRYCVFCHDLIFGKYVQRRKEIEKQYEDDLEYLDERIRQESLAMQLSENKEK
jgi:hypothetical protein